MAAGAVDAVSAANDGAGEPDEDRACIHLAQQVVLQEMVLAERHARKRLARIEVAVAELMPDRSLVPVVEHCRRCAAHVS